MPEVLENLRSELRRGSLIIAVLAALRAEQYGYSLRRFLHDRNVSIDESALYPMLRRLEEQGLLSSEWREEERRRKRFYRLSPDGHAVLAQLETDWRELTDSLNTMLQGDHDGTAGPLSARSRQRTA